MTSLAPFFLSLLSLAQPAPTLRGTVVDESGKPVEGATVMTMGRTPESLASVDTASDGAFTIGASPGASLSIVAPGFVTFTTRELDPDEPLKVVLERARGVLTGVVKDASTYDAVAGAVIEARTGGSFRYAAAGQPKLGVSETSTDADGVFRLEGLGPIPMYVRVSAPGYSAVSRTMTPSPDPIELFLMPGSGLFGVVVDEQGAGVEGATGRADRAQRM